MNTPSDWQSIVTVGIELVQASDRNRWYLGDLAALAERVHGESSIKKLATEIRMPRHKTLYEYHRVSKFYDSSTRGEFAQLSWSHYREATRLGSLDNARELLAQANDEDRPVAWLTREVKKRCGEPITPNKLLDLNGRITGIRGDILTIQLLDFGAARVLDGVCRDGDAVRLAIWELLEQPITPAVVKSAALLGGGAGERRIR